MTAAIQPERIINQQPQAINNCFGLTPNEHIITTYTKQPGGCGCGPTFTVHLTNNRLIQRREEYACCGDGQRVDTMLFLSDISSISDTIMKRGTCSSTNCCDILCCPCLCCFTCCKDTGGKHVGIRGGFGEEVFTFSPGDAISALKDIPAAAMPHKGAAHQY